MKAAPYKKYADYIPFIIIVVSAVYLLWSVMARHYGLFARHYTGLVFTLLTGIAFSVRHVYGVLVLGLTLFLGLAGVLSLSPAIATTTFGFGGKDLVRFQQIFILWLVIYFIVCGRHFTGILSRKYWQEVKNKER